MVVQTGPNNLIRIKKSVYDEICRTLSKYPYESGGIIGADKQGIITAFQPDVIQNPSAYEYYPNTEFLNKVINDEWRKKDIEFVGFVHSHLHNCEFSKQDIEYAGQILKANKHMENILSGILNLENNSFNWMKF